uniref:HERV-H LTR-associating 2b, tandem duplicate 1 n=1 Tax=Seriola dumerili TaxID=41447 RepID=A0A3B4TB22_SERDU
MRKLYIELYLLGQLPTFEAVVKSSCLSICQLFNSVISPCVMFSDVTVTCFVSEECVLPCSFQPGSEETIEWFRQDVVVYKFDSSEEHSDPKQLGGRASVFPHLVSRGNATLILRGSGLKDRGTYRCHVRTSNGEHNAKVILKVEGDSWCDHDFSHRVSSLGEDICNICHRFCKGLMFPDLVSGTKFFKMKGRIN